MSVGNCPDILLDSIERFPNGDSARIHDFSVKCRIARGCFGDILLGTKEGKMDETEPKLYCVIKRIDIDRLSFTSLRENIDSNLLKEVNILRSINHPNVVKLLMVIFVTHDVIEAYLVFDFIEAGPIMQSKKCDEFVSPRFISPVTGEVLRESLCSYCFQQIFSAMEYIHSQNIAHRDLKPDNILVSFDATVKIVDFGVSEAFGARKLGTEPIFVGDTQGTWLFWAPEICSDDESTSSYDALSADVWACGMCLWICTFGTLPYFGTQPIEVFDLICAGLPPRPWRSSPELEQLFDSMLCRDPRKRVNFSQCRQLPWITQREDWLLPFKAGGEAVENTGTCLRQTDTAVATAATRIASITDLFYPALHSLPSSRRSGYESMIESSTDCTHFATMVSTFFSSSCDQEPGNRSSLLTETSSKATVLSRLCLVRIREWASNARLRARERKIRQVQKSAAALRESMLDYGGVRSQDMVPNDHDTAPKASALIHGQCCSMS